MNQMPLNLHRSSFQLLPQTQMASPTAYTASPAPARPTAGFGQDQLQFQSTAGRSFPPTHQLPPLPVRIPVSLSQLRNNEAYLKLGDKGASVEHIQQRLKAWGANVTTDGYYGLSTMVAVQQFQQAHGIQNTGHVGQTTLAALDHTVIAPSVSPAEATLAGVRQGQGYFAQGSSGTAVEHIQNHLKDWGYNLKLDGEYGPNTASAVRQFQIDQQLPALGWVDRNTLIALEAPRVQTPQLQALRSGLAELKPGDEGEAVEYVQERLRTWGHGIQADGAYGPKTTEAIRRFQRDRGIQANGRIGATTLAALDAPPPPDHNRIRPTANGDKLGRMAERVARRRGTTGWCYAGVADSVARALGFTLWGKSAYMAADILAGSSDFKEAHNIRPQDLKDLPAGAIVVWGKTGVSKHGHISVSLGDGREASDHVDTQRTQLRGHTNFRVFMPL